MSWEYADQHGYQPTIATQNQSLAESLIDLIGDNVENLSNVEPPVPPKNKQQYQVVWEPLKGSQTFALTAPAHHVLYCGARGPGKTAVQLGRFRSRVGIGYGRFWRGIIFDREFKNLADLLAQSKRMFEAFGDGAKWHNSPSDYKWTWPTGEELLFRHVKKIEDYDGYHGHEYCLAIGEKIKTPTGDTAIEQLKVGDLVLTPKGYRKVTKIFPRQFRPCVLTSFYDKDSCLISEQVTSTTHRTLTIDGSHEILSEGSIHKVWIHNAQTYRLLEDRKSHEYTGQSNVGISSFSEYEESFSIVFCSKPLNGLLLPLLTYLFGHICGLVLHRYERSQPLTKLYRELCKFCERLLTNKATTTYLLLDFLLLLEPLRLNLCRLFLNFYAQTEDALFSSQTTSNLTIRCLNDLCLCDGLPHMDREIYQCSAQQLPCDEETSHQKTSDVLVNKFANNRPSFVEYEHPYTGKLERSIVQFSEAIASSKYCGYRETIDIEVEDANCYISSAGVVNKNCFIGWNELTKQPTSELYDKFMSVNRSSFIPEKDTPKKATIKGETIYDTPDGKPLPPIPLEVFSTTNPSGPGHQWVKRRFITPARYGEIVKKDISYFDTLANVEVKVERTQVAIFGSFYENPYLDPVYKAGLIQACEHDPHLKAAWIDGSWDVTSGGAIDDLWTTRVHIVPRFIVPSEWKINRSFDWGSSHPCACVWWAEANGEEVRLLDGSTFTPTKGSLIAIADDYTVANDSYGKPDFSQNAGLRLSAVDVAARIKKIDEVLLREKWIGRPVQAGPADNQIRDVREKDVETIAVKMAKEGVSWTRSDKSPGSRKIGLQLMRDRLVASILREKPGIYFMSNCKACIELLPNLPRDTDDPDDVDTDSMDHVWDAVRYRVLTSNNRLATNVVTKLPH